MQIVLCSMDRCNSPIEYPHARTITRLVCGHTAEHLRPNMDESSCIGFCKLQGSRKEVHLRPLPSLPMGAAHEELHWLQHPGAEGGEAAAVAGAQPHLQCQRLLPRMPRRQDRYRLHDMACTGSPE